MKLRKPKCEISKGRDQVYSIFQSQVHTNDINEMNTPNEQLPILICGAGITGPVLAYWLHRGGRKVVILERAESLRTAGQQIDIRGPAIDVVRLMGIEPTVRKATVPEKGAIIVDDEGKEWARFDADPNAETFTAEYEIVRTDLVQILYDQTKSIVDYIFGDYVEKMEEKEDRVSILLANRQEWMDFSLVIGADGLGSRTRRLAFGEDDDAFHSLGQFISYYTIPNPKPEEDHWATFYSYAGRRNVLVRPNQRGEMAICFSIRPKDREDARRYAKAEDKKAMTREIFGDMKWKVKELLEGLDHTENFYCHEIAQIRLKNWSKGRVALAGDAACVSVSACSDSK